MKSIRKFWNSFLAGAFVSVFCLHSSCLANLSISSVKDLEGPLKGVEIVRLLTPTSGHERKSLKKHFKKTCNFYVKTFSKKYTEFMDSLNVSSIDELEDGLREDCKMDARDLGNQQFAERFYFFEAREKKTGRILGLAAFKEKLPGVLYLSDLAATHYREPNRRGIGKQLFGAIFDLVQNVKSIELIVLPQNTNAIAAYRGWGFVDDPSVTGDSNLKGPYQGMKLDEAGVLDLKERLNSSSP